MEKKTKSKDRDGASTASLDQPAKRRKPIFPTIRIEFDDRGRLKGFMDFFMFMEVKKYDLTWATYFIKLAPVFFGLVNKATGQIQMEHPCTRPITTNINAFQTRIQNDLFGNRMVPILREEYNLHLRKLMGIDVRGKKKPDGDPEVGYSFRDEKPRNLRDVKNVLFKPDGRATRMIRSGQEAAVLAWVWLMIYHPMLENNCDDEWLRRGMARFLEVLRIPMVLVDENCNTRSGQRKHMLYRYGKKKALGSFQQSVHGRMKKDWGINFQAGHDFKKDEPKPPGTDEVDIGPYLPSSVVQQFGRNNGTVFRYERVNLRKESAEQMMERSILSLVETCRHAGMSQEDVSEKAQEIIAAGFKKPLIGTPRRTNPDRGTGSKYSTGARQRKEAVRLWRYSFFSSVK